ncbi:hypothetical protein BpHYR1_029427 [Brachionus plicatilis]|uniref:Uncharacterized protein n=1 Tax=Brachionus plicatilis TaxID=10195 RepID=A0A3M7Q065_BRAPC|nr:hypothetical protein BpHYR1_029427 [Brachionus plicatilis]
MCPLFRNCCTYWTLRQWIKKSVIKKYKNKKNYQDFNSMTKFCFSFGIISDAAKLNQFAVGHEDNNFIFELKQSLLIKNFKFVEFKNNLLHNQTEHTLKKTEQKKIKRQFDYRTTK